YDARGNVLTDTRKIDGKTYTTAYTYDLADHVASITYPSGDVVAYARDRFGRIASVSLARGHDHDHDRDDDHDRSQCNATSRGEHCIAALASGATYLPFGPLSGFTFGNGVQETF